MAHEVFISYSVNDKQIADLICSTLESNGIQCWIAPRDILPGMDWGGSIIDAIAACRVMVLLLSSNSNMSSQVRREVERAVNKNVIIIPFRIENVSLSKSLEYHLSVTHWMDASTPPIEKHIQTLAEKIRQILPAGGSAGNIPVQKEKTIFAQSEPSSQKWSPIYFGVGGLVVGLILFTGLIWWMLPRSDSPPDTAKNSPATNATPILTPKIEENKVKDNAATPQNKNTTPNTVPSVSGQRPVPPIAEKSYDEARKILIDAGWQPNKNRWTYGENENVKSGNGPLYWEKGYWELVSCAGTGTAECRFEFIDENGRILVVITQGEEDEKGKYHATVIRSAFKKKINIRGN